MTAVGSNYEGAEDAHGAEAPATVGVVLGHIEDACADETLEDRESNLHVVELLNVFDLLLFDDAALGHWCGALDRLLD